MVYAVAAFGCPSGFGSVHQVVRSHHAAGFGPDAAAAFGAAGRGTPLYRRNNATCPGPPSSTAGRWPVGHTARGRRHGRPSGGQRHAPPRCPALIRSANRKVYAGRPGVDIAVISVIARYRPDSSLTPIVPVNHDRAYPVA